MWWACKKILRNAKIHEVWPLTRNLRFMIKTAEGSVKNEKVEQFITLRRYASSRSSSACSTSSVLTGLVRLRIYCSLHFREMGGHIDPQTRHTIRKHIIGKPFELLLGLLDLSRVVLLIFVREMLWGHEFTKSLCMHQQQLHGHAWAHLPVVQSAVLLSPYRSLETCVEAGNIARPRGSGIVESGLRLCAPR